MYCARKEQQVRRAMAIPLGPGGTRGPFILQEDPVGELEEDVYPYCGPA